MFGLFFDYDKRRAYKCCSMGVVQRISYHFQQETFVFGPFNQYTQRRWKKPIVSARTRLEDRTRDLTLDKLMNRMKRLKIILKLQELMSKRKGPYVSVQILSRWKNIVGLKVGMGIFLHKYPHIFEIFTHSRKGSLCCKLTQTMVNLIEEEVEAIKESEMVAVQRLKKLLMISSNGALHIHALRLIRKELGLPGDFRDSILVKYHEDFKLVNLEIVALVSHDDSLAVAEVEKWREEEYRVKWLSEFEIKYAFRICYPTGYKIEKGCREKLKNWQRLPYLKPYEKKDIVRIRSCGGIERFEKRAVGILHEFLSITVEKRVEIERLSHFRKDFNLDINVRELLLKHPGIFYISTKGGTQTVFLREAYSKGCLIEPNPISIVRSKMLDILLLGCRNTKEVQSQKDNKEIKQNSICNDTIRFPKIGGWVIPILEDSDDRNVDHISVDTSMEDTCTSEICSPCLKKE